MAAIFIFLSKLNKSAMTAPYRGTVMKFYRNIHIPQPLPKDDQMTKIDTGSKLKMAAAAIL